MHRPTSETVTLHDLEIEASLIGNLGPIGKLAKGIDGFFYLKKSIEDVEVVVFACCNITGKELRSVERLTPFPLIVYGVSLDHKGLTRRLRCDGDVSKGDEG